MRDRTTLALLGLLLGVSASSAGAQYRREAGDTIRVREVTTSRTTLGAPSGAIALRSDHAATIAVVAVGADSARGWYETLQIAMTTPQGRLAPATDAVLFRPFMLTFDARGRIATLRTPEFPAAFEGVTDLSHQFDDLLVRLPGAPLALGLSWVDTAVVETRGPDGATFRAERIIRSRVVRDTVMGGESGWVIESIQRSTLAGAQRVRGQPTIVRTTLSGVDSGFVVFSREHGRMLSRERSGGLSGTLTYEGGPRPVVVPMEQRYENVVRRVP
ncbi:MAG: hypothetical protein KA761_02105 [Gemmatimonadaceae bacterium]|nr:hypothetical protein [Gemmatimonadaceae bacterium]